MGSIQNSFHFLFLLSLTKFWLWSTSTLPILFSLLYFTHFDGKSSQFFTWDVTLVWYGCKPLGPRPTKGIGLLPSRWFHGWLGQLNLLLVWVVFIIDKLFIGSSICELFVHYVLQDSMEILIIWYNWLGNQSRHHIFKRCQ